MKAQETEAHETGPHCDLATRNVVLQVMDYDLTSAQSDERYLRDSLDGLLSNWEGTTQTLQFDDNPLSDRVKEELKKKGEAFVHTQEYYAAIKNETEKMRAYRTLKVSLTVPHGEDAEIAKNPFKFLNLSEDSTFGQVRAAYIWLSKQWFPDLIFPENREQFERIFGASKPASVGNYNETTSIQDMLTSIKNAIAPKVLDARDLAQLSPGEREKYQSSHEEYDAKEKTYAEVKAEMRRRATEKMSIINKAYSAAGKLFSNSERQSFAGFEWEKFSLANRLDSDIAMKFEALNLEGGGQIRRDGKGQSPYLAYDYGDSIELGRDYRQRLNLKQFFAWAELIQGKDIAPTLLDDIIAHCELSIDQAEQLRLMMINHEKPKFIADTLGERGELIGFVTETYRGPEFSHTSGWDDTVSFKLGVEFTPEGGLVLKYKAQSEQLYSDTSFDEQAQFKPVDVQLMQALAYGPQLTVPKSQ